MFFLQSPYPQHFFHAANPPFVKKFRAPERIGYQGTAIFAQPPPPPCRRARRRADNPAGKPVRNTDNRTHRARRSQTNSRRNPTARTPAVRRACTQSVYRRRAREPAESANRIVAVVHPPSLPIRNYASYIRAWQSAESPSADIGGLTRAEKRRQLPNTQMFSAHNKLIINNRIQNIHRKPLNYIHLSASFAPESRRPQPIHPPTLFFCKKIRTSISLKLIITTEQSC